jgi:hypothetical protein
MVSKNKSPIWVNTQLQNSNDQYSDDNLEKQLEDLEKKFGALVTSEDQVEFQVASNMKVPVTLVRGISKKSLENMQSYGCASGNKKDPNIRRPSNEEAKLQAGRFIVGETVKKLPEFTTNLSVAKGFSRGHFLVFVDIDSKYLTQCSVAESGWCCLPEAPVNLKVVIDRTYGKPEVFGPDGS